MRKASVLAWRAGLVCLALFVFAQTAPAGQKEDFRVKDLPGLKAAPPFEQYAGHLNVDRENDDHLFFWLFESASSPRTDPLLIWLSGGPGCSSIAAMFEENGPLRLAGDQSLSLNPHSWNQRANIVYLDQPVGTGLSYSQKSHLPTSQNEVNKQFYNFLKEFLKIFPEYAGRTLYLTGESYAGHMIPCIAAYILNQRGTPGELNIRLGGLAIGNGWVDPRSHIRAAPEVAHAFGLIDESKKNEALALYEQAIARGGNESIGGLCATPGERASAVLPPAPAGQKAGAPPPPGGPLQSLQVTEGFAGLILPENLKDDPYAQEMRALLDKYRGRVLAVDLSVKDFIALIDLLGKGGKELQGILPPIVRQIIGGRSYDRMVFEYLIARVVSYTEKDGIYVNLMDMQNYGPVSLIGTPTTWPGGDDVFEAYMSRKDVQRSLHAASFPGKKCESCNPLVYLNLIDDYYKSALPLLPGLLKEMPLLFYNGHFDLICNQLGTERFLLKLAGDTGGGDWPGKKEFPGAGPRPWTVDGKRAGYYKASGNLRFLTILEASHMVPLSVPRRAQVMINTFIHGASFMEGREKK